MFKIGSQRLTWITVKWHGLADDGSQVENEIECQVHLVDRSELQAQMEAERKGDLAAIDKFCHRVTQDWKGVGNVDGEPLKFTEAHFAMLLESPGFATALGDAYFRAWRGQATVRQGNLEASPAAGGTEAGPENTVKSAG